jgi:hypothetical protein
MLWDAQGTHRMSTYVNASTVRHVVAPSIDNGEMSLKLLHGEGGDAGRRCIHRVQTDSAGRLRSDIVYFYDESVKNEDVEADFILLSKGGLMSMGLLHHTESMLNRGARTARRG